MPYLKTIFVALLLPLFLSASAPQEEAKKLELQDTEGCVMGTYLPGTWEFDTPTTEHLGTSVRNTRLRIEKELRIFRVKSPA